MVILNFNVGSNTTLEVLRQTNPMGRLKGVDPFQKLLDSMIIPTKSQRDYDQKN